MSLIFYCIFRHDRVKSTIMVMWPSGMLPYPHNVLLGPIINPGEGIEPSSSPVVDRHLSLSEDKMSIDLQYKCQGIRRPNQSKVLPIVGDHILLEFLILSYLIHTEYRFTWINFARLRYLFSQNFAQIEVLSENGRKFVGTRISTNKVFWRKFFLFSIKSINRSWSIKFSLSLNLVLKIRIVRFYFPNKFIKTYRVAIRC